MWVRRDAWYAGMGYWCVSYFLITDNDFIQEIPLEYSDDEVRFFKELMGIFKVKPHPTNRPDPRPSTQSFKSWYVWIDT